MNHRREAAMTDEGSTPPVDPWDAVATLEVLDAARRSATEGVVVDL
jgi:hypothetical protein